MAENELMIFPERLVPEVVFAPGGVDAVLEKLTSDVRAIPVDISTKDGRAACASLARKVASSKTALDELGKNLVADWKAKSALVDADRRRVRERLDALRDEVRKPLTEWEDAERGRVEGHEKALAEILSLCVLNMSETSEELDNRIKKLEQYPPRDWHEFAKRFDETKNATLHALTVSLDSAVRREAERAELARLRKEAEEREQRERDNRLRAEAAEAARKQAEVEAAEAARVVAAREATERARVDRERVAAEERALREKEEWRRAEETMLARVKAEKEKSQRLAEEAVEAERRRVAGERAAAEAEKVRREANKKHREKINKEIISALAKLGFEGGASKMLIEAIAGGSIPHVRIEY